jgi:uncharacterized protein YndB with AHSA1/START domain
VGAGTNRDEFGRLERVGGQVLVTFTRRFPSPPGAVWGALTEPDQLAAWFPTTIEGELAPGAPLRFRDRDDAAPPFDGVMLVYEPPSSMSLRWGDDVLRFEVHGEGDGTVLTLTVEFAELGKVARDGAGWHACLDLLGCVVARRTPPWSSADRWREVHPGYVEDFGPEASTIGPPQEWERVHGSDGDDPRPGS